MAGFFTDTEVSSSTPLRKLEGCMYCRLGDHCNTPKMKGAGKNRKNIMILADHPSEMDDANAQYLSGSGGRLLKKTLSEFGIDAEKDCRIVFAISCRPLEKVSSEHIIACRPHVVEQIKKYQPSLILCLGDIPLESLIGERMSKDVESIGKWRGFVFPDRLNGCWVAPLIDLGYLMKNGGKKDIAFTIFRNDIQNALQYVGEPLPTYCANEEDCVHILNESNAISRIKKLLEESKEHSPMIAFDYETNVLKPEVSGASIKCCSVAVSPFDCFVFMWTPRIQKWMVRLLKEDNVKKIASNMKFEERWSIRILKTKVAGWFHDTMLMMHVLDNRSGICSIKFIAQIYFGLFDYDVYMKQFWDNASSNTFNSIDKADPHRLLLYCGMDSLIEFRTAVLQMKYHAKPEGVEWRSSFDTF